MRRSSSSATPPLADLPNGAHPPPTPPAPLRFPSFGDIEVRNQALEADLSLMRLEQLEIHGKLQGLLALDASDPPPPPIGGADRLREEAERHRAEAAALREECRTLRASTALLTPLTHCLREELSQAYSQLQAVREERHSLQSTTVALRVEADGLRRAAEEADHQAKMAHSDLMRRLHQQEKRQAKAVASLEAELEALKQANRELHTELHDAAACAAQQQRLAAQLQATVAELQARLLQQSAAPARVDIEVQSRCVLLQEEVHGLRLSLQMAQGANADLSQRLEQTVAQHQQAVAAAHEEARRAVAAWQEAEGRAKDAQRQARQELEEEREQRLAELRQATHDADKWRRSLQALEREMEGLRATLQAEAEAKERLQRQLDEAAARLRSAEYGHAQTGEAMQAQLVAASQRVAEVERMAAATRAQCEEQLRGAETGHRREAVAWRAERVALCQRELLAAEEAGRWEVCAAEQWDGHAIHRTLCGALLQEVSRPRVPESGSAETLDRADSALEASSGPSRGPGTLSFSVSARSALELEESCGTEAVAAELASLTRQVGRLQAAEGLKRARCDAEGQRCTALAQRLAEVEEERAALRETYQAASRAAAELEAEHRRLQREVAELREAEAAAQRLTARLREEVQQGAERAAREAEVLRRDCAAAQAAAAELQARLEAGRPPTGPTLDEPAPAPAAAAEEGRRQALEAELRAVRAEHAQATARLIQQAAAQAQQQRAAARLAPPRPPGEEVATQTAPRLDVCSSQLEVAQLHSLAEAGPHPWLGAAAPAAPPGPLPPHAAEPAVADLPSVSLAADSEVGQPAVGLLCPFPPRDRDSLSGGSDASPGNGSLEDAAELQRMIEQLEGLMAAQSSNDAALQRQQAGLLQGLAAQLVQHEAGGAALADPADSPDPAALQYPGVATASPSALPAMLAALQAENALLRTTVAQHRAAYRDQQQATLLLTTELAEARRAFVAELAVRTAEGERWRARAERFEDGGPFDSPGVSSPPPAPRPGPHGGGGPPPWPPHLSTGWASPPPCATAASSSSSALEPSGTTAIPSPAPPQSDPSEPEDGVAAAAHLRGVQHELDVVRAKNEQLVGLLRRLSTPSVHSEWSVPLTQQSQASSRWVAHAGTSTAEDPLAALGERSPPSPPTFAVAQELLMKEEQYQRDQLEAWEHWLWGTIGHSSVPPSPVPDGSEAPSSSVGRRFVAQFGLDVAERGPVVDVDPRTGKFVEGPPPGEPGVRVVNVRGPAEREGVLPEDVITHLNGYRTGSLGDFRRVALRVQPGEMALLGLRRGPARYVVPIVTSPIDPSLFTPGARHTLRVARRGSIVPDAVSGHHPSASPLRSPQLGGTPGPSVLSERRPRSASPGDRAVTPTRSGIGTPHLGRSPSSTPRWGASPPPVHRLVAPANGITPGWDPRALPRTTPSLSGARSPEPSPLFLPSAKPAEEEAGIPALVLPLLTASDRPPAPRLAPTP